jgi:hypothetical protein
MAIAGAWGQSYWRNGPLHRAGADVSFADIVHIFGFRSIKIGRWVRADEQQQAANWFFDSLCDLQHLLQLPATALTFDGRLSLSFGTGGQLGTCAHYQPQGRILALAKHAGGGSLAHEWFHAFDHHISDALFDVSQPFACVDMRLPTSDVTVKLASTTPFHMASALWLEGARVKPHRLNQALDAAYAMVFLQPDGSMQPFVRCSLRYDQQQGRRYYGRPEELAARAFERMLQSQGLKNTFLVSGTLQSAAAKAGLYPDATHSAMLASLWFGYFQQLGVALQAKNAISRVINRIS